MLQGCVILGPGFGGLQDRTRLPADSKVHEPRYPNDRLTRGAIPRPNPAEGGRSPVVPWQQAAGFVPIFHGTTRFPLQTALTLHLNPDNLLSQSIVLILYSCWI